MVLPAGHPLAALQAQAALAAGWPVLSVVVADETTMLHARGVLEGILGPLPQADEIEPFDPADPWELRCELPGLTPAVWEGLRDALAGAGTPAALWPGDPPAMRAAEDAGLRVREEIAAGGVVARMDVDAEEGGVLGLDLFRAARTGDPEVARLEADLTDALRTVDPRLGFRSDAGDDTVQPVVWRTTGRFGVLATIPEDVDVAVRERIVAALGDVVRRRADDPVVRIAPDVRWDVRLGLSFVLFFVAPAVAALPSDQPVPVPAPAPVPGPVPLSGPSMWAGASVACEEWEVQVVPTSPAEHVAVAAAVSALAELDGGPPRWVIGASGDAGPHRGPGWAFVPTWRVPRDRVDVLRDVVPQILALPGVAAVRVVPGEPIGLSEPWAVCAPAWHVGARRVALRARDGLSDKDWLVRAVARDAEARDAVLRDALGAAIVATPAVGHARVRTVRDSGGRKGMELAVGKRLSEAGWRAVLDAVTGVPVDGLDGLVPWGFRPDGAILQVWWEDPKGDPPAWS